MWDRFTFWLWRGRTEAIKPDIDYFTIQFTQLPRDDPTDKIGVAFGAKVYQQLVPIGRRCIQLAVDSGLISVGANCGFEPARGRVAEDFQMNDWNSCGSKSLVHAIEKWTHDRSWCNG